MKKLNINKVSGINQIINCFHDQWFDINEINYSNQTLSIKFQKETYNKKVIIKDYFFFRKIRIPIEEYYLRFNNVIDYKIEDTEKISLYNFNYIEYEHSKSMFNIVTGIPLKFEILSYNFDVIIEETGLVVDNKVRLQFF